MKYSILALAALSLMACSSEVEVNYKLSETVPVELYVESIYSTFDLAGVERVGTITADYVHLDYSQNGDTTVIRRSFEIDNSRDYLKNSHPAELQWRLPVVETKGVDLRTVSIQGFDEFDSLLYRIPMPQRWRNQLLNPDYIKHLERQERHRYEMTHLLKGPVPTKGNITKILEERGRLKFGLIQIDSVVTSGFQTLDKRECLNYTVYIKEKENFPYYIWEQHVNSKIGTEKFQAYNKGLSAEYETAYRVAIDPTNGIPCQEQEIKHGVHTMVNAKTGDTATFRSSTGLERLYTYGATTPVEK